MNGIRIHKGPVCRFCRERIRDGYVHKTYPDTGNLPSMCIDVDERHLPDLKPVGGVA